MKLNVSYPRTGAQKVIECDDDKKLMCLMEKRMASEIDGAVLGEDFAGYVMKISGGNDKQGFPMKQGVLHASRVRLLVRKGVSCYRPRRSGERKRKSVRGCITGPDLAIMNLVIVKKGEKEIEGITDTEVPRRLGPKRANKIRKLFNLKPKEDVRKFVVARETKYKTKRPKIQRLVTPERLQRRRHYRNATRNKVIKSLEASKEHVKVVAEYQKEIKARQQAEQQKKKKKVAPKEAKPDKAKADKAKPDKAKADKAKPDKGKAAPAMAAPAKTAAKTPAKPAAEKDTKATKATKAKKK